MSVINTKAANGLLKTVVSDFAYSADGSVKKMKLGNGLWETTEFNALQQLTQIGLGTTATSKELFKVDYEYGELNADGTTVDATKNIGNIARTTTTIPTASFVQTFKYDALNRLTEAKETTGAQETWKQTFGYDRYGNRTQFSQTIGGIVTPNTNINHPTIDQTNNRFTTGQGYVYDFNGNIVQDAEGRTFTFNGDDKQTEVRDTATNQIIGQYFYDGSGARVKKVVPSTGETTVFVYDAGGALAAEYSTVVAPVQEAKTSYLTTDHLGSPRVITDGQGNVISRRDFMPFGEEIGAGVGPRTEALKYSYTGSDNIRKRFTGYEKDEETGLDFAEARMYESRHGRFTSSDPLLSSGRIEDPQSWNRYIYVGNNPLFWVDPTGLIWGKNQEGIIRWFDKDLGEGFEEFRPENWQYVGQNGRVIQLDPNSSNWSYVDPVEVVAESNPIEDLVHSAGGALHDSLTGLGIGARNAVTNGLNALTQPLGSAGAALGVPNPFEIAPLEPGNARQAAYAFIGETGVTTLATAGVGAAAAGPASAASALSILPATESAGAQNFIYSSRVLIRSAEETGPYHNFPMSFDSTIISSGTRTSSSNFVMYRQPGTINGRTGVFEIGTRPSPSGRTEVIRHRFFRP